MFLVHSISQYFRKKYEKCLCSRVPCGLVLGYLAFHQEGPGSIPGMGTLVANIVINVVK